MKSAVRLLLRLLPGLVVVLIIIEIIVTNELVHYGKSVQAIDRQIDTVAQENERIAQNVASASSLIAIEQKAKSLGFISASAPIVLGQEEFALQSR